MEMHLNNLIFVASQPRAGSTYLQSLLSNNPKCNTASEPWIMLYLAPLIAPQKITASYDYALAAQAMDEYRDKYRAATRSDVVRDAAIKLYAPLFNEHSHVVDKTPRYWEILNEIVNVFPESKVILLIRNPINVAKSIIQTWGVRNINSMLNYRNDLLNGPIAISDFLQKQSANPNVRHVYYEDIVAETEKQISELYEWSGMEYDPSVLDHASNSKFQGKFGDPYSNNTLTKNEKFPLSECGKDFLGGYAAYLQEKSLSPYRRYDFSESKPSRVFDGLLRSTRPAMPCTSFRKFLLNKWLNSSLFRSSNQFTEE